ncbi:hypothetical protein HaLaN_04459 [Haematococcus lacustris]|uniref:Uncharacterized protein n=1 Tax=Haematococcus lacustris TaxID=44745 RepID=A0A699YRD2_HAELA|nr:hypothetical protein HaLaN_04459 [Haematococcus lacustris]
MVKDFQLQPLRDAPGQRKLHTFRQHAAPGLSAEELFPQLQPPGPPEVKGVPV